MSISVIPENIRALALDLDGTILTPGAVLTERTRRALQKCKERGIRLIISTGRAVGTAEQFRVSLEAEGPMIYFNGALVSEMPENKILRTAMLDAKAAEFCVELSREMKVYCLIYFLDEAEQNGSKTTRISLMAEWDGEERQMYYKHTGLISELCDLKEEILRRGNNGCVKAMFLTEPEVHNILRPRLEERLGKSIYIANTFKTFLEVMDAEASKGQGLEFVMKTLSLKREEVIAFGDEESDIPLFAAAGFSVAPSNAKDAVKASSDLVVASCAEDGVAAFLEEFFRL